MSQKKMYFITQAKDKDEAISEVDRILETEVELCDDHTAIDEEISPLNETCLAKLLELQRANNPFTMASKLFEEGMRRKNNGDLADAGFLFWQAGGMWMGKATLDIPYYNITECTFEIPYETEGWFCVPAMVHY